MEEKNNFKRVQMWVSINFKQLVQELIKNESIRGNIHCSEPIATEILVKRIQKAGGLKKY